MEVVPPQTLSFDMKSRPLLVFIVLACFALHSRAQQPDSLHRSTSAFGIIDTVIVSGNTKTKDFVILNEMTLKPGVEATAEAMEFDRDRIYSLGLFTRVEVYYDSLGGRRFLLVDVSERWHIIPLPIFGFRDGDPKKFYFGAGLLHNNFSGRNQKLFASAVFGFDPAVSLSFSDPLFIREESIYVAAGVSYATIRNRSQVESALTGDYDEKQFDLFTAIGKRFDLYQTGGITAGYRILRVPEYMPGRTASTTGRDGFIYGSLNYVYDSRDLREYAMNGRFYSFSITRYGIGESEISFTRYGMDIRHYVPLPGELSLAARAFGSVVSGGLVPTYAREYLGYGERVRGYFTNVFEGENIAGTTLELRYPLLKARTIFFSAVPLPAEFAVWRFGISVALFADAATTWFRGDRLQFNSFASGYGGSVDLLLPYSKVVRLAYAYNEYFKGQFILDLRGPL